MASVRSPLLATSLAVMALGAHAAQYSLEVFAPPNNGAMLGLSAQGQTGVTNTSSGNWYLNADRNLQNIGGVNSQYIGIDAAGRYINGAATAADGTTVQAGRYDVTSGTWTALGGLGAAGSGASMGFAISASGTVQVGTADASVNAKTVSHAAVFQNGTVTDLTPGATSASRALSVNADGSVVVGYVGGSAVNGTVWKWNAAAGSYNAQTITGTNAYTNAAVSAIAVSVVSANGQWAAGDSTNGMGKQFGAQFSKDQFLPASFVNLATGKATAIPYDHVIDTSPGTTDIDASMKATVAGVSNDGAVIGMFNIAVGYGSTGLVNADAFIYFASTGQSYTFDSYLDMLGLGLTPTQHVWSLYSMSANGDAISGAYFDSATNQTSAFIVHSNGFIPSAVPEPGQWALLALGLPLLMVRRLRQPKGEAKAGQRMSEG
ncbi:MAG TPA: hypothetical protein VGM81_15215 [Burkholderiaceae bacterium]|jgi:uncharacterized membrane protein